MSIAPTLNARNPTVSVAMCTFNGGAYLPAQLESIATQTRRVDEIVICDDGSTDGVHDIVKGFIAGCDVPVRFQINPIRLGVTKNFEQAISRCSGDFIFLADQDDVWAPGKVALFLQQFEDPGVGLVFSDGEVIDEAGNPLGYSLWDAAWFTREEQQRVANGQALPVLLRHAVAAGCSLAFRGSFKPMLLPIPDIQNAHDIWITLLIACAGRLRPIDRKLLNYRLHDTSTIGLRRHGIISQLKMARWQLNSGAFQHAAQLYDAAMGRLLEFQVTGPTDSAALLLQEKVHHSRLRHEMPKSLVKMFPKVLREWRKGNYQRFSYGYKSVLQDLFLR